MALSDQTVPVVLSGGVDTTTNPHLVVQGKLERLVNARFAGGTLEKRNGFDELSTATTDAAILNDCTGLAAVGAELLRHSLNQDGVPMLYSYGGAALAWVPKAEFGQPLLPLVVGKEEVVRNTSSQRDGDTVRADGLLIYAWLEEVAGSDPEGHLSVFDEATGALYQAGVVYSSSTRVIPRLVHIGGSASVLLLYGDTSSDNLYVRVLDTTAPTALGVETVLRTDCDATDNVDALPSGAAVYRSGVDELTLLQLDSSGVVLEELQVVTNEGTRAVLGENTGGYTFLACRDDEGAELRVRVYDPRGATDPWVESASFPVASAPDDFRGPGMAPGPDNFTMTLLWGAGGITSLGVGVHVRKVSFDNAGVLASEEVLVRGVDYPLSFPFVLGGRLLVALSAASETLLTTASTNPLTYVVDVATGAVVARVLNGLTGSQQIRYGTPPYRPPRPQALSDAKVGLLLPERGRLSVTPGPTGEFYDTTQIGLCRELLEVVPFAALPRHEVGFGLCVGGAAPYLYDGDALTEMDFNTWPDALTAEASGTGELSAGTYQYTALYEWVDGHGVRYQSAPAIPVSVVVEEGQQATVTAPALRLTRKLSRLRPTLVWFRTEADGQIFYRLTQPWVPQPMEGLEKLTYADGLADDELLGRELLYTTGDVLEAQPPPPYRFGVVHDERLVVAGLEDPYEVRFTTRFVQGQAPRWNEVLRFRVPQESGAVVALGTLDDKLVVLTAKGGAAVYGEGPNAAGLGSFSQPQPLATVPGCISPHVVSFTDGLAFQSPAGWRLLRHELVVDQGSEGRPPWGSEVDAYADWHVTAANLVQMQQQLRIQVASSASPAAQLQGAVALVYDYLHGQWSTYEGPDTFPSPGEGGGSYGALGAVVWRGRYVRAPGDDTVCVESGGYQDAGLWIRWGFETSWLKLGSLLGFGRIRKAQLLGTWHSDVDVVWETAYDYGKSYPDSEAASLSFFDNDYAEGSPVRAELAHRHQKCTAVRYRVRFETGPIGGAPDNKGLAITGLQLLVGLKPGLGRLPSTLRMTGSGA